MSDQLTLFAEEHPARPSPSPDSVEDWMTAAATWPSSIVAFWAEHAPTGSYGKMSQVSSRQLPTTLPIRVHRKTTWEVSEDDSPVTKTWLKTSTTQTKAMRSPASWPDFRNSGMGSPTELWTLSTSVWNHTLVPPHSDGSVCSLSDILETGAHLLRYCLSPKACAGIIRRAVLRGKDVAGTLTKSLGSGGPDDNQARDGQLVAGSLASRVSAGGGLGTDVECDGGVVVHEEVAGAVSAKWAKGSGGPAGDECYNLVPHPAPASPALTGNPYGDHESREGLLVAHTRRAEGHDATEDGTGRGTPIIPFDTTQITNKDNYSHPKPGDPCHPLTAEGHPPAIAFSCKDHGGDVSEDVSPTLRVMPPDKSHANAGGQVAVAIQERMESLNPENGPHGKGWSDDGAAFTLEARHRPQSVLAVADTVRSHPRPGSNSTGNIVAVAVDTRQDPCVYGGTHGCSRRIVSAASGRRQPSRARGWQYG